MNTEKLNEIKFEVKLKDETLRLNVGDVALLFATDKRTVRGHLKQLLKEAGLRRLPAAGPAPARGGGAGGALAGTLFPNLCLRLLRALPAAQQI